MRDIYQLDTDLEFENKIRPQQLDNFSGQDKIVENLRVFIKAAFFGPFAAARTSGIG